MTIANTVQILLLLLRIRGFNVPILHADDLRTTEMFVTLCFY